MLCSPIAWNDRADVCDNALTLYQQGVPHRQSSLAGSGILMHPIRLRKPFDNGPRNVDFGQDMRAAFHFWLIGIPLRELLNRGHYLVPASSRADCFRLHEFPLSSNTAASDVILK